MSDSEIKYFMRNFLNFLTSQLEEKKFSDDCSESIEVAIQCLQTAYELPPLDNNETPDPLNNINIFDIFRNACFNINSDRKSNAEALKNDGNRLMKEEKHQEALNMYNRALSMDATNPVYYCNRAAAWSKLGDYNKAADDCKMSIRYDPNYSKAYGRLGLAYSKMSHHNEALEAYRQALRIEPDNVDYQNNMSVTQQRVDELIAAGGVNAANSARGATNPAFTGIEQGIQNLDFAAAFNNPNLMNLAARMISEPTVQDMLSQLSGMNNMDSLLETGRQLAMQMNTENPELMANIRRQMGQDPNAPNNPEENPQNPNNAPQP